MVITLPSIATAIVIPMVGRVITTYRESNQEKKPITDTTNKAKKIKSGNFRRRTREKSKLLLQYWKNKRFVRASKIYLNFGCSNIIFADHISPAFAYSRPTKTSSRY